MSDKVGVKVFPSTKSSAIRKSESFIHYSPIPDPPIDYTLREKPRRRPDYLVTNDPFKKSNSPDYTHEEDLVKNPPRLSEKKKSTRRPTQIIHNVLTEAKTPPTRLMKRRDTLQESEIVLGELDSALEHEEKISFQEAKERLQAKNLPIRQYAPSSTPLPDYYEANVPNQRKNPSTKTAEKTRILATQEQKAKLTPVLDKSILEDLKSMSHGADISSINEHRRKMVEDMFAKTERLIEDARSTYTVEFFMKKNPDTLMPQWKKQLLAKRAARDAMQKFEENAWDEFFVWKKKYAPNVGLRPEYQFASKPTL